KSSGLGNGRFRLAWVGNVWELPLLLRLQNRLGSNHDGMCGSRGSLLVRRTYSIYLSAMDSASLMMLKPSCSCCSLIISGGTIKIMFQRLKLNSPLARSSASSFFIGSVTGLLNSDMGARDSRFLTSSSA